MKLVPATCALLAAAALTLGACNESDAAAIKDSTQGAMDSASKALDDVDLSKLSPDALADKAKSVFNDLKIELEQVKDSQTAKDLVAKFQPVVDQLSNFGTTLAGKFDSSSIKAAIDNVVAKFKDNPAVINVLQPLIDKLRALFA